MKFVTKRKVDELGRIVLPIEYRAHYSISAGDAVAITATDYDLVLSKASEATENTKTVDELGRVVIPAALRKQLNISSKELIAIIPYEDGIHLSPTVEPIEVQKPPKTYSHADVYEKDYTASHRRYRQLTRDSESNELLKRMADAGVFAAYNEAWLAIPRIVNAERKAAYDKALELCDRLAMIKGGKVRGVVNYESFDATIDMVLPTFEFFNDRLDIIRHIASTARNILFETNTYGEIRMHLLYDYFEEIEDPSNLFTDEVMKHPDLVDDILAHEDKEKEVIMNDPQLRGIIEMGAEGMGITPEEYLDRLDMVIKADPDLFMRMLHEQSRKENEEPANFDN